MSRIGKKPVKILKGVKVEKSGDNITVNGPKGSLSLYVNPIIKSEIKGDEIEFTRGSDLKREKSLHGLYAILVKNMIMVFQKGSAKN
jgi:large subunit ribosomal protein L6